MSRVLLITLSILLISQVFSQSFLEKKLESVNFLKCLQDGMTLKTEIVNFINQVKEKGITIDEVLSEFTKLEPEIQQTLTDCGIADLNIARIVNELENAKRPISFDPYTCFQDVSKLITAGQKLVADIEAKNYLEVISDLTTFVGLGKQVLADCLSVNATMKKRVLSASEISFISFSGIEECIADVTGKLLPDLEAFVTAAKAGDIGKCISLVNTLMTDFNQTLTDCSLGFGFKVAGPIECIEDITQLVKLAVSMIENIKSLDFSSLVNNVMAFVGEVKKTIGDCSGKNSTVLNNRRILSHLSVKTDVFKCLTDIQYMVEQVTAIYNSIRSGNFSIQEIITRVEAIISDFKDLEGDCGLGNLTKYISFSPEKCLSDLETAISGVESIWNDFQAKNYEALIFDVIGVIPVIRGLTSDCLGYNLTSIISKFKFPHLKFDPTSCLNDISYLWNDVMDVIRQNKSDYSQLVVKIVKLILDVDHTAYSCLNLNLSSTLGLNVRGCAISAESAFFDVEQTVRDFKTGNYENLINDALVLFESAKNVSSFCFNYNLVKAIHYDPEQCLSDVSSLAKEVSQLAIDIASASYSNIPNDILAIVNTAQKAYADCVNHNSSSLTLKKLGFNPEQCLNDLINGFYAGEQLVSDIKAGNYSNVLNDLNTLIQAVRGALADCANVSFPKFTLDNIKFNPGQCLNDIIAIVPAVEAVIQDIKNKDFGKLIQDGEAVISAGEKLYSDCLSKSISLHEENVRAVAF